MLILCNCYLNVLICITSILNSTQLYYDWSFALFNKAVYINVAVLLNYFANYRFYMYLRFLIWIGNMINVFKNFDFMIISPIEIYEKNRKLLCILNVICKGAILIIVWRKHLVVSFWKNDEKYHLNKMELQKDIGRNIHYQEIHLLCE